MEDIFLRTYSLKVRVYEACYFLHDIYRIFRCNIGVLEFLISDTSKEL